MTASYYRSDIEVFEICFGLDFKELCRNLDVCPDQLRKWHSNTCLNPLPKEVCEAMEVIAGPVGLKLIPNILREELEPQEIFDWWDEYGAGQSRGII